MPFSPFPELQTERLLLRKLNEADSDAILFLRSDPSINKYIERPENNKTKNKADALRFIKRINEDTSKGTCISWGITLQVEPRVIGSICLWNFSIDRTKAEVGYDLNPLFQRKGIMSEALIRVIVFGFETLKLHRIEAFTDHRNESSKKILLNNGFLLNKSRKDEENSRNLIFELSNDSF